MVNKKVKEELKVGDTFKLAVEDFGENNDPIMFYQGKVIFLKNTNSKGFKLGQKNEIRITKVFPKYAFAEVTGAL